MRKIRIPALLFAFAALISLFNSCTKEAAPLPPPATVALCDSLNVTYSGTIDPILQAYCATPGCHVAFGSGPGDYTLYADVKAAVDAGVFKQRALIDKDMPPSGPLPDSLLLRIQCWLNDGAPSN